MLPVPQHSLSRLWFLPTFLLSLGTVLLTAMGVWAVQRTSPHASWLPLALAGGALVVTTLGMGWWLRQSLLAALAAPLAVLEAAGRGEFQALEGPFSSDELGRLCQATSAVVGMGENLAEQAKAIKDRHDQGEISFRMDNRGLPGAYGQLVGDLNSMVAQHIGVKMRAVDVMRSYAAGDLSVDMDRLPGEKAVITDAMDRCKQSLLAINGEINRLARAAAAGDFSLRGEENRFQHDFLSMVQSLNAMMATSDRNLARLSSLLNSLAEGDLTARMDGEFHGVFATMCDDANRTVGQLTAIVRRIHDASSSIQNAAGEIASGNADLSQRTEQQAANLEETAASMEELTLTVKQNAQHAQKANHLALATTNVATQGGKVVEKVAHTMADIERSSQRIADITSLIDGIAFQTNILALNAAVEAARAGEQGRGFAVVASEVRTLAQKSAASAKEIKALIEDSTSKVSQGTELAKEAGRTMEDIVTSVENVARIMGEISAASQEQASGIDQVNQTITHMDASTQQNAALVEEASAAATSMATQAVGLSSAIAAFRLEAGSASAMALNPQPDHPAWRR